MTALVQGVGISPAPSPRSIRHAIAVLERLPLEALVDLAERIIDRLDTVDGDLDFEPDEDDACEAEDVTLLAHLGIGEEDDAEEDDPHGED